MNTKKTKIVSTLLIKVNIFISLFIFCDNLGKELDIYHFQNTGHR